MNNIWKRDGCEACANLDSPCFDHDPTYTGSDYACLMCKTGRYYYGNEEPMYLRCDSCKTHHWGSTSKLEKLPEELLQKYHARHQDQRQRERNEKIKRLRDEIQRLESDIAILND